MALAIDGSTPAVVVNSSATTATITTASFTPPAGSVLLILWVCDEASGPSAPSITDNLGGHLTYTQPDWKRQADGAPGVFGQAATWTAPVVSSAAMTVTVTTGAASGERVSSLAVIVLTGADTVTPVGAHGKSGSTSAAAIAQSYTAAASGGWGFIAVCDPGTTGPETGGAGTTVIGSGTILSNISYAFARRTTADDSIGAGNTLNLTLGSTSTDLAWVYAEIMPAAAAAGAGMPAAQIASQPGRRPAGQATVTRPTADPVPAGQPVPAPVTTAGRAAVRAGSAWATTPPADPSPFQNQPLPAVLVVGGRPAPPPGSAVVFAQRADPPVANPPCPEPFMSIGRPGPLAAAVTVLTPRADPSPAQNQPLIEPVITAGRPAAVAGAALLTASRADPVAASPPAPSSAVSAGRPAAPGGQAVLSAPRSDAPADLPPASAALTAAAALRLPAGTAITTRAAADEARTAPTPALVAAPVKTWTAAPAALTRSTFTGPAPVLVIRPPLVTIGFRPRLAGMAWFGHAVSGVGHVCPPPTTRPDTGTTTRPDTGLTLFGGALTGRPDTGTTTRPNTGLTPVC